MRAPGVRLRPLLGLAAGAWVGRWALLELAAHVSNGLPARPYEPDPARPPGRMPGPRDGPNG